ncbi:aldo/keto reductase [Actinoallomurus bryophytorum]|uniref:Aryl-alcohol dehydrogenase-like predicted oxidoreductase n=1 Tax=Actinoallomurus bryophytorum TaxID=1490222 RepID=A0A543CR43_9ACTN|nr:oxidoreductase [Actinoallomurus bryophytorum]TQL99585.1 aryl-alcohol dehydrogenase-like predicted oxidoreductase [Actinoallomurus bryophytorum]
MTNITAAAGGDFVMGGDLRVHRMGFGAMRLPAGGFDGPPRDPSTGMAVLRRAVELGVNHIDTAGFYERGGVSASDLIRRALAPYGEELVIATKVGPLRGPDGVPTGQATPEQLRGLVEDDLRLLGVDRLDLVYLRIGGLSVPGGESLADRFAVLAAMREEGLIRHLGLSNVDVAQLAEARTVAPVVAVQNHFHVQHLDDRELLRQCAELGVAYAPFFPLGGGFSPIDAERVAKVAARHGATNAQVALAWLLAISPVMLAIPGTGSPEHLEENIAAAGLELTEEDLADLEG